MRTTVDLPPAVHRRARELAAQRGVSMSTVLADLTIRGLAQLDVPVKLVTDRVTGLPILSLGRRMPAAQAAAALAEK